MSLASVAVHFLSLTRAATGLGTWLVPHHSIPFFGLTAVVGSPDVYLISRLFGIRDFILGTSLYYYGTDKKRFKSEAAGVVLVQGIVADVFDTVATLIAYNQGLSFQALILAGAGAATFVLTGYYLYRTHKALREKF